MIPNLFCRRHKFKLGFRCVFSRDQLATFVFQFGCPSVGMCIGVNVVVNVNMALMQISLPLEFHVTAKSIRAF